MSTNPLQPRLQVTNRNIDTGRSSATVIETSGGRGGCTTVSDMPVSPSRCGTGLPLRPHGAPERLFPVFRDRHELSAGANLDDLVQAALRQSRFLIVICPQTPPSRGVRQEIEAFQALGHETASLCIVDGEPGASDRPIQHSRMFLTTAPHPQGRRPVGRLRTTCRRRPPSRDGKTGKLKIIAAMLGVTFDELRRREDQRRLQQRVRLTAALALFHLRPQRPT